MINPSEADLGWLAGIIDGEGCIFADKHGLRVRVGSADPFMARECYKIYPVGVIQEQCRKNNYFIYYWIISTKQAGEFLKLILPYLKVKKEQAIKAIELQELRTKLKTKNYKYHTENERLTQQKLIVDLKNLKALYRGKQWQVQPAITS